MSAVENLSHTLPSYPHMSPRFYLPLRHDKVTKTFLCTHLKKYNPAQKIALVINQNIYKITWKTLVEHFNKSCH